MAASAFAIAVVSILFASAPPLHELAPEPVSFDQRDVEGLSFSSRAPTDFAGGRFSLVDTGRPTPVDPLLAPAGLERFIALLDLDDERRSLIAALAHETDATLDAALLRFRETYADAGWNRRYARSGASGERIAALVAFDADVTAAIDRFIDDVTLVLTESERDRIELAAAEVRRVAIAQRSPNFLGVALDPVLVIEHAGLDPQHPSRRRLLSDYREQSASLVARTDDAARRLLEATAARVVARVEVEDAYARRSQVTDAERERRQRESERAEAEQSDRVVAFLDSRRALDRLNRSTLTAIVDAATPDEADRLLDGAQRLLRPVRIQLNLRPRQPMTNELADGRVRLLFDALAVPEPPSPFMLPPDPNTSRVAARLLPPLPDDARDRLASLRERYTLERDRLLEQLENVAPTPTYPYLGGELHVYHHHIGASFASPHGSTYISLKRDGIDAPDVRPQLGARALRDLVVTPVSELQGDQRRLRSIVDQFHALERRYAELIRDQLPLDVRHALADF